ncbi:MAG: arginase family protein [Bacteroidetes bacterium]|nr:arginase family protein [Bacteroidota bacterium]
MMKILSEEKNFLGIDKQYSSFETSRVVIVPCPFDENERERECPGPEAILRASRYITPFDEETMREIHKELGIATLTPLRIMKKHHETIIQDVYDTLYELLQQQKFVVLLGGSHTIASPAIAAHAKYYPRLSVLHLSARPDLQKTSKLNAYQSRSTITRVLEFLDSNHLVQVGIRSLTREEADALREKNISVYYSHNIRRGLHTKVLKIWDDYVNESLSDFVYIDLDVSVFDSSIMPATISPQPLGLTIDQVLQCIRKVTKKRTLVGFNVVGLKPLKGIHYPDIAVAKIITKILSYIL